MALRETAHHEPLLAWPGIASFRFSLPLAYLFSKIFFSIYGGASLLARLRGARQAFHFDWEMRLPFVPSVAIVYLSVPLLLLLAPFILRTWRSFTPFFFTLTAETLVAGVFFLVLPMAQDYPQRVAYGIGGAVFRFADRLNLDYNEFPSLHVAFAVTAALVYGRRCGWLGKTLFGLWAITVSVSTLLMHEHHLIDIAAGAALGLAAVATVQRRTSEERFLDNLRIEAFCLRELAHLIRRRVGRLRTVAALFGPSLRRWRETQVQRAAWCVSETARDVLAGERRVKGDPEAYVRSIQRILTGEAPSGGTPAEQLAVFVAGAAGEQTRRELIDLIERLLAERRREEPAAAIPLRRDAPADLL
jgi:membrane-associated phospholipid phosphatase